MMSEPTEFAWIDMPRIGTAESVYRLGPPDYRLRRLRRILF
jgi:hypothetical protein